MLLRPIIKKSPHILIVWALLFVGLYLASLYSYTLFHFVAESFSIVIAISLFIIALNTSQLAKNNYILFLSIAFLFAGLIDFVHTLAYKGMGIFQGFDANLPTQLWIIARYLQSLSLLAAPWFIDRKLNIRAVLGFYLAATLLLLATVFSGTLFPDCFIEGKGLTHFKIISEYIICLILIASLVLLLRHREKFDQEILRLIVWSILFTIVSELAFTFYISVYGLSNLIGHYFKIVSFYLIYRAIIVTGLENPYRLLFHDLYKNKEELQTILDASPIMIFYKDNNNKFIRVNRALAEATGQAREGIEGKTAFEVYPNQATGYLEDDKDVIASGKPKTGIIEPIDTEMGIRWVQTDKIPYRDMDGRIIGIIGFSIDITNQKKAEEALWESEGKFRLFIESLPIGLYRNTPGPQGRFIMVNTALARLHGFDSIDEFLSQDVLDLYVDPSQRKEVSVELMEKGFVSNKEVMLKKKDGTPIWGSITARAIRDNEGKVVYFDGTVTDITDRKRMEEKIHALSITDQLTGFYNRRGFLSLVEQQLKLSDRNKSWLLLFFADLDLLKQINDTLGHEEGDKALIEAANVLKETFRASDIIARLGGDEFAVLAIDIKGTNPEIFTARLQQLIDIRNNQESRKYNLSISIGCSFYNAENPCSIDDLIARADKLMYEQKQNKKSLLLQSASLSSGNPQHLI
ncbi:MAG: diguanylate cyclase [Desulfobacteraceae bacterium]|nr:MAG: diguanylate cyclase [Desulfobacteraceae bacterium]